MADGTTEAIKDVKTDQQVLATDPTTGKTQAENVTQPHDNQIHSLSNQADLHAAITLPSDYTLAPFGRVGNPRTKRENAATTLCECRADCERLDAPW